VDIDHFFTVGPDLDTVVRLERLRQDAGILAPELLDHGTVSVADPAGSQRRWWAVLERAAGRHYDVPTPGRQAALGVTLRTWHDGDRLTAVIDSGEVDSGPPMLDLAWALALDLPHGGAVAPLLDGYGRDSVDQDALAGLLPLAMARRLADVPQLGAGVVGAGWLVNWLDRHAPPILALVLPELRR
jgi:hypothetical protein